MGTVHVHFGGHTAAFPHPPTTLLLSTALKIGIMRIREKYPHIPAPRRLRVALNGETKNPRDRSAIVPEDAVIVVVAVPESAQENASHFLVD
jgi:hypothetical protein